MYYAFGPFYFSFFILAFFIKKPKNVKNIQDCFESIVQDLDILKYKYRVIKAYEIDKNEILEEGEVVLYPLRVFMKYEEETEEEHMQECLRAVEDLEDKDYYYLTVQCIKKLYKGSEYEIYVREEILMQSVLYQKPFDKGRKEGIEKGRKEGKLEVVRNALKEGMEIDLVAKLTGLSKKEIKEIAKEIE